jgi:hypothetical protein
MNKTINTIKDIYGYCELHQAKNYCKLGDFFVLSLAAERIGWVRHESNPNFALLSSALPDFSVYIKANGVMEC